MALALGVPTATAMTKDPTTDIRPTQEDIIPHYRSHRIWPFAEEDPWLGSGQQSHWVRDYMGYDYRGLEGVIYDLDRAGIGKEELEAFQQTLSTGRNADERRLMTAVLAVHGALPPEEFVADASDHIGYRPFASDAYLLRQIHDDEQLRELFFDRARLLEETRGLQAQVHHPREDDEGRLYDETPDLESLDSLNLVRLNLLLRAVRDAQVQQDIGSIVAGDLANTRTEFGGLVYHDDAHHVRFQPVTGVEWGNGSYVGQYYWPLLSALGTFHLHALGNGTSHHYSGPSVPDLRVARMTNTTGVVITLLERSGTAYAVNVDFYYIDARTYNDLPISESNPVELSPRTVRVVDMGIINVRKR